MVTIKKAIAAIQKGRTPQANYQEVMLKFLAKNGASTKGEIALRLKSANNDENDLSFYMAVPVFKILLGKGLVSKTVENGVISFKLKGVRK